MSLIHELPQLTLCAACKLLFTAPRVDTPGSDEISSRSEDPIDIYFRNRESAKYGESTRDEDLDEICVIEDDSDEAKYPARRHNICGSEADYDPDEFEIDYEHEIFSPSQYH